MRHGVRISRIFLAAGRNDFYETSRHKYVEQAQNLDYTLAISWLCPGYIPAISRPHLGYMQSAKSCLQLKVQN
jgi:hypothetical protein